MSLPSLEKVLPSLRAAGPNISSFTLESHLPRSIFFQSVCFHLRSKGEAFAKVHPQAAGSTPTGMRNPAILATGRRLAQITAATAPAVMFANPASAPVLARMVSQRKRPVPRASTVSPVRLNGCYSRSCSRTRARTAATSKYSGGAILWMNRPPQSSSSPSDCENCDSTAPSTDRAATELGQVSSHVRLDLQTNNSKKEGSSDTCRKPAMVMGSNSSDYNVVSEISESASSQNVLENMSAIAKGADAMVNMSLSRQTEIIDTSMMAEDGKVETEYEEEPFIEHQDHAMVDEYEKTFAYARRLRALLNGKFTEADRGSIETNFLLVKAHEHPTQKMIDRWRNVDMGVSYNDQVKLQKLIEDSKANAVKKKGKKGEEVDQIYPELIRFTVRFRKENSEKRWRDYMDFRQNQKKQLGAKAGAVPKPNDKYLFAFLDVWSFCVVVFARPTATVREIVDPVFARLGLDRRADFSYTIGCFTNDKRAGKAKIQGVPNTPDELEVYQTAAELYKKNCTEIYVNDNRCEMFNIFPDYYTRHMPNDPNKMEAAPEKRQKKTKGMKDRNNDNSKNAGKDAVGKDLSNAAAKNPNKSGNNQNNALLGTIDENSATFPTVLTPSRAAAATASPIALATSPAAATASPMAVLPDEAAAFEKASGKLSPHGRLTVSEEMPPISQC